MENPLFDKADRIYKKLTMLLLECQELENNEEYPLIKEYLSKAMGLINRVKVESLKNPPLPD